MTDKASYVLRKVFSGRWILTVFIGVVFLFMGFSLCWLIISNGADFKPEIILGMFGQILGMVGMGMGFYFSMRKVDDGNGKETPQ
jgi:hypothetical protein